MPTTGVTRDRGRAPRGGDTGQSGAVPPTGVTRDTQGLRPPRGVTHAWPPALSGVVTLTGAVASAEEEPEWAPHAHPCPSPGPSETVALVRRFWTGREKQPSYTRAPAKHQEQQQRGPVGTGGDLFRQHPRGPHPSTALGTTPRATQAPQARGENGPLAEQLGRQRDEWRGRRAERSGPARSRHARPAGQARRRASACPRASAGFTGSVPFLEPLLGLASSTEKPGTEIAGRC